MNDIPKTIYYCWFGPRDIPKKLKRYMKTWRLYMPGYKICRISEENFDYREHDYTYKAYENKKYAFVSDYARFDYLYKYGGIYLDTDVELVKSLEPIVSQGPYMGVENEYEADGRLLINPGLGMAVYKGMPIIKEILEQYDNDGFCYDGGNTKNIVGYTTDVFERHGFECKEGIQNIYGINVYPKEYFCPRSYLKYGETVYTENTYSIHQYEASWMDGKNICKKNIAELIQRTIGYRNYAKLIKLKSKGKNDD